MSVGGRPVEPYRLRSSEPEPHATGHATLRVPPRNAVSTTGPAPHRRHGSTTHPGGPAPVSVQSPSSCNSLRRSVGRSAPPVPPQDRPGSAQGRRRPPTYLFVKWPGQAEPLPLRDGEGERGEVGHEYRMPKRGAERVDARGESGSELGVRSQPLRRVGRRVRSATGCRGITAPERALYVPDAASVPLLWRDDSVASSVDQST